MSEERPKTITELFFAWLSDFTLKMVEDKWVRRIFAATAGLVFSSWCLAQNADSISKIIDIFR